MQSILVFTLYLFAACAEIVGCYSVAHCMRGDHAISALAIAVGALACFAVALTYVPGDSAGKTYAAYGAIYIVIALTFAKLREQVAFTPVEYAGIAAIFVGVFCLTFAKQQA